PGRARPVAPASACPSCRRSCRPTAARPRSPASPATPPSRWRSPPRLRPLRTVHHDRRMAQKQSILGRISQLTRANLNALLDKAEDPQKMLDQMVRDYTDSIAEAEQAVAQTIGNLRLAEADHAEDVAAAKEWGGKAIAASNKADQLRSAGHDGEADRFDQLAKMALGKQISAENEARAAA